MLTVHATSAVVHTAKLQLKPGYIQLQGTALQRCQSRSSHDPYIIPETIADLIPSDGFSKRRYAP